jgi:hypothetical protein
MPLLLLPALLGIFISFIVASIPGQCKRSRTLAYSLVGDMVIFLGGVIFFTWIKKMHYKGTNYAVYVATVCGILGGILLVGWIVSHVMHVKELREAMQEGE